MTLTLPTVGVTAGPAYATQINAALTVVDGHDHSTGSGVQITPAGININADLSINSMNVTDVKTVRFTAQPAALAGASPNLAALYVVNEDLYYNDGLGNQVAITASGAIAGAPGNITNLVAPASVTYTSGGAPNYKFMSTATESANLDAASLLIRNLGVAATYALTLQAPTLVSNYGITLPILPAAASFVQIDSSGIITNTVPVALGITAANLAADSVTTAKILDANVTTAKILDANVTPAKLSFSAAKPEVSTVFSASGNLVVPAGVTSVLAQMWGPGAGGGGGASGNTGGGGGGASGAYVEVRIPVVAGETLSVVIGNGAAGGGVGVAGTDGISTSVFGSVSTQSYRALGGRGGSPGSGTSGGAGGTNIGGAGMSPVSTGGSGGSIVSAGSAGQNSITADAAAGMAAGAGSGGGSGGAGRLASGTQVAGNNGTAAAANSAAGGGGGAGNQSGGAGGSGYAVLTYVPVS